MTEGHESDFLVTVRAQVMTRDESTEGWLPLAGGGLANVSIRKRARLSPGATGHEYIIYGQRISDQHVILSCVINRDLKYYKVMPTFHHWRAGKQRNGLTFQTAADARAFDKGVLRAYNELIDGLSKTNPSISTKNDSIGEDDVFMTLDLPMETESIHKTHLISEGSEKESIGDCGKQPDEIIRNNDDSNKPAIQYISNEISCLQTTSHVTAIGSSIEAPPNIAPSENYSYVTLTAVHDYNYPVIDQPAAAQVLNTRRESISTIKKRNAYELAQALSSQSAEILKEPCVNVGKKNQRMRCRYCHELYNDEWNRKGACEFAPDCFRSGFEYISGMGCARCMLYHCMSDAEGETPQHPCECSSESGCAKRWIGLSLLSLIVPCLWCYLPLRVCHWVGVSCGICGGKHTPQV